MANRRQAKEDEFNRLFKKTTDMYNAGARCLVPPSPDCCPCGHKGSDFIVDAQGNPMACGCPKPCPAYDCLNCNIKGNTTPFCTALKQMAMLDL